MVRYGGWLPHGLPHAAQTSDRRARCRASRTLRNRRTSNRRLSLSVGAVEQSVDDLRVPDLNGKRSKPRHPSGQRGSVGAAWVGLSRRRPRA